MWVAISGDSLFGIFATTCLMELFVAVQVFGLCSQANHRRAMVSINEEYSRVLRATEELNEERRREMYEPTEDAEEPDYMDISSNSSYRSRSATQRESITEGLTMRSAKEEKSKSKSESVSTIRMIRT
jgi:hypothetical protein